jgi:hypothetical protein
MSRVVFIIELLALPTETTTIRLNRDRESEKSFTYIRSSDILSADRRQKDGSTALTAALRARRLMFRAFWFLELVPFLMS